MDSTEAELESFRKQWREEVSARSKDKQPSFPKPSAKPSSSKAPQSAASKHPKSSAPESSRHARQKSDHVDEVQPHVYRDLGEKQHGRRLDEPASSASSSSQEPQSALDHYEQAVEKESQGSLGDSLNLYRKAFKVDHSSQSISQMMIVHILSLLPSSMIECTNPTKQSTSPLHTLHHFHLSNLKPRPKRRLRLLTILPTIP